MDSLSIQYNLLYSALLRFFGDRVELMYIDASSGPGREELRALESGPDLELPVVADGDKVLFSGRIPVTRLIKCVQRMVETSVR